MRSRAHLALLGLGLVACGSSPGTTPTATIPRATAAPSASAPHRPLTVDERRAAACAGNPVAIGRHAPTLPARSDWTKLGNVVRVDVRGSAAAEAAMRPRLPRLIGAPIDPTHVRQAIRELWAEGLVDDVAATAEPTQGGVVLVFVVTERPPVGSVFYVLPDGAAIAPGVEDRMAHTKVFDPSTLTRNADDVRTTYEVLGHRRAKVEASAAAFDATVDVCFRVTPGPRFTIASIAFPGARNIPETELVKALDTKDGTVNTIGRTLDVDAFGENLLQMSLLYYERGMINHRIGEPAITESTTGDATLKIEVPITEGPIFRWGKITFAGPLLGPASRYEAALGIKPGEVFKRSKLKAGIERIRAMHHAAGQTGVDAEPETTVDVVKTTVAMKVVVSVR
ncbi:MAG: outer membrane protein assembly factor YaeT precursor [Myxococcaceae bacterium]|nr:outer membrane protein assembly factor YaeT precursor [Myxococcaceae bacterium]